MDVFRLTSLLQSREASGSRAPLPVSILVAHLESQTVIPRHNLKLSEVV